MQESAFEDGGLWRTRVVLNDVPRVNEVIETLLSKVCKTVRIDIELHESNDTSARRLVSVWLRRDRGKIRVDSVKTRPR